MAKSNGKTKLKADRKKEDDSTSRRKALDIKESKRKKDKNKKKYHDVVASDVGFPLGPNDRIGVLRCVEGQLEAAPSVWMDNLRQVLHRGWLGDDQRLFWNWTTSDATQKQSVT